jgi:hypothetical protein
LPIKIEIFKESNDTNKLVKAFNDMHTGFKNQRAVKDFHVKDIKEGRELKPVPGYEPKFVRYPLKKHKLAIKMSQKDYEQLKYLQKRGLGDNDEDAFRSAVMTWYTDNRTARILPNRMPKID